MNFAYEYWIGCSIHLAVAAVEAVAAETGADNRSNMIAAGAVVAGRTAVGAVPESQEVDRKTNFQLERSREQENS